MSKSSLLLSVAFATVMFASIIAFTLRSGGDEGWRQIVVGGIVLTSIVLIPNAIALAWARKPRSRAARLRDENPGSIVVESARLGGLESFLTVEGAIDPVLYVTVVIDPAGITFWRDYGSPRVWSSVNAVDILAVDAEPFLSANRVRHRLRFTLGNGDLFVPVLGAGSIGIMSPSDSEVESLAERVRVTLARPPRPPATVAA